MKGGKRNSKKIYKHGEVIAISPFGPYNPKNIQQSPIVVKFAFLTTDTS